MRIPWLWLALVVSGLHSLLSRAESPAASSVVHSIGADYGVFLYQSTGLPISAGGASLLYRARFPVGVSISAGVRFLHVDRMPNGVAFEGFVGAQLSPEIGVWRPLAGIELGTTTLQSASLSTEPSYSPAEYTSKQTPLGPSYAGFVLSPLRFCVRRITFGGLGLQLGTHLPDFGSAVRIQLVAAHVEWSF